MHIVYFNKRSNASATKESETGQNYFTDTQEFTILTPLAYQGNQLNFKPNLHFCLNAVVPKKGIYWVALSLIILSVTFFAKWTQMQDMASE